MSVRLNRVGRTWSGVILLALGGAVLAGACGARDEIPIPPPPPPLPECLVDADCEGFDDLCRNVRCVARSLAVSTAGG